MAIVESHGLLANNLITGYNDKMICIQYNSWGWSTYSNNILFASYRYVLRNYIAQNAIEKAEKGDFSEVNTYIVSCIC